MVPLTERCRVIAAITSHMATQAAVRTWKWYQLSHSHAEMLAQNNVNLHRREP